MIRRLLLLTKHPTCILVDEATNEITGVDGETYLDYKNLSSKIDKMKQEKDLATEISCTTAAIIH